MKKGINDYKINEKFEEFLLVKEAKKGVARNGNPFLNVTLADATGEVTAMVWDATEGHEAIFTNGEVVKVQGVIGEYQGNRQINLQRYRKATENDPIEVSALLKSAPIEGTKSVSEIKSEINQMINPNIQAITLKVLEKFESDFKMYPAAKQVHHDYVYGLAYHTYTMMNIGKSLCVIYPELNKDLLLAGIILHDIGKVVEYDGYVGTDYTLKGKLIGHIPIIFEEIGKIAEEIGLGDTEERVLLQHMVLSHHGKGEWGSPVTPQVLEAQILHQIDMIDAGVDAYKKGVAETEEGEFTDKVFGLGNRSFYKPNI